MGQRVAELRTPGSHDTVGYIVYQSTAMANFTPIFGDQLSAELFAFLLQDIYPNWDDKSQEDLCSRLTSFIRNKFTDSPDGHPDYEDYLFDNAKQAELLQEFRNLPAAPAKA